MVKYLNSIFIVLALSGIILFSACNIARSGVEKRLQTVQEKTPFTIVTPTYLPKGMSPSRLSIGEPSPGFAAGEVMIILQYQGYVPEKSIIITEMNREVIRFADPNNPLDTTFYIKSIQISKSEGNFVSIEYRSFSFNWNIEGINYHVTISGYDEEECKKVISSMIPEEN